MLTFENVKRIARWLKEQGVEVVTQGGSSGCAFAGMTIFSCVSKQSFADDLMLFLRDELEWGKRDEVQMLLRDDGSSYSSRFALYDLLYVDQLDEFQWVQRR